MTDASVSGRPHIALGYDTVAEIPKPISLVVTGTLPPYLGNSTLYRVGPGKYNAKHSDGRPYVISHWFDGLTLLHAFHINASSNSVQYRSHFLTESLERTISSVPRSRWSGFSFGSPDPCRSILGKLFQLWTPTLKDPLTGKSPIPNVGVTVQNIPTKGFVTRTDSTSTIAFDEETLEIDHFFRISEDVAPKDIMSASHGHFDSQTNEYINYSYSLGPSNKVDYTVFRILPTGQSDVLATLNHEPCYIHSFAVTTNYVILIFWPIQVSALSVLLSHALTEGLSFNENTPTRFAVIARDGRGLVADYEAEPFFSFHVINAYENDSGNSIIIDLSRYDNADIIQNLALKHLLSGAPIASTTLSRYRLRNLSSTIESRKFASEAPSAERIIINEHDMELARVNGTKLRTEHRYIYGVSNDDPNAPFSRIAKIDVTDGSRVVWGQGDSVLVGEPIFVPDPEGSDEDHGCLLLVGLDVHRKASRMVVLDARNMKEVSSAIVPQVVPFGFHGAYLPK